MEAPATSKLCSREGCSEPRYEKGKTGLCIEHKRETQRAWQRANREKLRAQKRKWAAENPEKVLEKRRRYAEVHKVRAREHYEANRDRAIERTKRWRKDNPEALRKNARAWANRRRMRLAGAEGVPFTQDEWVSLKLASGCSCLACGRTEPEIVLEPDHVVPIAKGGRADIDNIQPLCVSCNRSKCDKTIDYR